MSRPTEPDLAGPGSDPAHARPTLSDERRAAYDEIKQRANDQQLVDVVVPTSRIEMTYVVNARAAFKLGAPVLVYPGGDYETFRPTWHGDQIEFGGRQGIRLALEQPRQCRELLIGEAVGEQLGDALERLPA